MTSSFSLQPNPRGPMKTSCLLLLVAILSIQPAQGGTASKGTVYIGAAFGIHNVYKVNYDYDGVASMTATATVLTTLPTAANAMIVPGGDIIVATRPWSFARRSAGGGNRRRATVATLPRACNCATASCPAIRRIRARMASAAERSRRVS